MTDHKPCPWCSSTDARPFQSFVTESVAYVKCSGCAAKGPVVPCPAWGDPTDAWAAWDAMAPPVPVLTLGPVPAPEAGMSLIVDPCDDGDLAAACHDGDRWTFPDIHAGGGGWKWEDIRTGDVRRHLVVKAAP